MDWRPSDFKGANKIESECQRGLPEERKLDSDKKKTKITLTLWIDSIRVYMEERGMDTVFRVYDADKGTKIYLLKDWGKSKDEEIIEDWIIKMRDIYKCEFDIDNLKWSRKAIVNSITLNMWEHIEKDLEIDISGPEIFAMIIRKQQHLNSSSVRKLIQELQNLKLINEPGQNVSNFSNKVSELAKRITGSGSAPDDLTVLVAVTYLDSTRI